MSESHTASQYGAYKGHKSSCWPSRKGHSFREDNLHSPAMQYCEESIFILLDTLAASAGAATGPPKHPLVGMGGVHLYPWLVWQCPLTPPWFIQNWTGDQPSLPMAGLCTCPFLWLLISHSPSLASLSDSPVFECIHWLPQFGVTCTLKWKALTPSPPSGHW